MKCNEVEVAIVSDYENQDNVPKFESLDKKINRTLRENEDKEFVDIRYLEDNKAMIIMSDKR